MVGEQEFEVVGVDEIYDRQGFGFGIGGAAAVCGIGDHRAGAFVIQTPVGIKIAVDVHDIGDGDLAVPVVVAMASTR